MTTRLFVLSFVLLCSIQTEISVADVNPNEPPFKQTLTQNAAPNSPELTILTIASAFLTDEERQDRAKDKQMSIAGRDMEADQVLDTLVRLKGAAPILIGPAGVGKTTTVQRAVQRALLGEYPDARSYNKVLDNAVWIQTSAGRILKLVKSNNPAGRMAAIEAMCEALLAIQEKYKRNVILYIDEIHSLDSDQVEALLPYMDSEKRGLRIVGSTNSDKFQRAFKNNDAFLRRVHLVGLEEFGEEQVVEILNDWWVAHIEKHYRVRFAEHTVATAVRVAPYLIPEAGRFDASIKTLQDLAIAHVRARRQEPITEADVYTFAQKRTGFPVNPHDSRAVSRYLAELKAALTGEIVNQPRMISDVIGLFQSVILGTRKGVGVGVLVGPTGTGKSELGKALARLAFKNPNAYLSIDANDYQSGTEALRKLLGAEAGLVGYDDSSGILPEFLDDPSRGKYGGVILIDEGERAHPKFWERLMEFLDTGSVVGGDGRRRNARRHLVLITSNRGDSILFPEKANLWTPREMEARIAGIRSVDLKNLFIRQISGRDNFSLPVPVLNRVDVFTVSQPITQVSAEKIVAQIADKFAADTLTEFHVQLNISDELKDYLAHLNFNLRDGARPIIDEATRVLQNARTELFSRVDVPRDAQVTMTLEQGPASAEIVMTMDRGQIEQVELPRKRVTDPLADPELRERLRNLSAVLREALVGQEQVIKSVESAVKAHFANAGNKKPLCLFVVGLTGTGKTLLGKAIAKALFGSEERADVIPLGHIGREEEFTSIFGSNPGYIGSDRERVFENALKNHPTGGVIIWDEASNLGAGSAAQKDALFKKFYNITDEGKWTSDSTRETYDLSREVFLFTGNDGEKLFQGVTDDYLRNSIWEENNDRAKVRELLVASGVPAAFLGRMADTLLMKPLLRTEVLQIARQRLDPVLQEFRARGVQVETTPGFDEAFANAFYSPDTGARSLRSVAENRVRGLMTQALIDANFDPAEPQPLQLTLRLRDEGSPRNFRLSQDPERKVTLEVVTSVPGARFTANTPVTSEDLTEYADERMRLPIRQALKTAYHEAGHAVLNDPNVSGQELRHLTILPSGKALGFASYKDIPGKETHAIDRGQARARIARLLAGQLAMMLAGFQPDSGWSNDLERARSLATKFVREWGLSGGLASIATDKKGHLELTEDQQSVVQTEIARLMHEGTQLAMKRLSAEWPFVRQIVKKLLDSGFITGEQFSTLRSEYAAKTAAWTLVNNRSPKCVDELLREAGLLAAQ